MLTHLHPFCFLNEILNVTDDCNASYRYACAFSEIKDKGEGVIVSFYQEGYEKTLRDIINEPPAHKLLDRLKLRRRPPPREHPLTQENYELGALALQDLEVQSSQVLATSPDEAESLSAAGMPATDSGVHWDHLKSKGYHSLPENIPLTEIAPGQATSITASRKYRTANGTFTINLHEFPDTGEKCISIVKGNVAGKENVLTRMMG